MYFKQFYLGCLAQASYLIGSEGEAVVVDPRRDVEEYLAEAQAQNLKIKYVIETHVHADFVSGHRELAERTGAEIIFGARAGVTFPHRAVKEGDEVAVGKLTLRFLETPGHTPESISVLVLDPSASHRPVREGEPRMVLTGDTLFIGDVGRPDLVGARGLSAATMAGMLYDSLHQKLLSLPDAVEVYPAHGAGSLCGRNMSKETSSTIGEQRKNNYALRPMPKDEFVNLMTVDLPEVPRYFSMDVAINREGAAPLAERPSPVALGPVDVQRRLAEGAVAIDLRPAAAFGAGHVPGSINIGLSGQFASWAGCLLDAKRPLVMVTEDATQVREGAIRLARVGLENVAGFLDGGVLAWQQAGLPVDVLPQWPVDELRAQLRERPDALQVVDVRRAGEYGDGHVPGALNIPLDRLEREVSRLNATRPTAVICAGGYRSSAAAGILRARGFADLFNVVGGTSAWVAAGYETEKPSVTP